MIGGGSDSSATLIRNRPSGATSYGGENRQGCRHRRGYESGRGHGDARLNAWPVATTAATVSVPSGAR